VTELPDRLLTMQEVADYLDVPLYWVQQRVRLKTIPHTRVGRHVRFTREHIADIIAAGEQLPHVAKVRSGSRSAR
jgi:excisionase family DNA binding protein